MCKTDFCNLHSSYCYNQPDIKHFKRMFKERKSDKEDRLRAPKQFANNDINLHYH